MSAAGECVARAAALWATDRVRITGAEVVETLAALTPTPTKIDLQITVARSTRDCPAYGASNKVRRALELVTASAQQSATAP